MVMKARNVTYPGYRHTVTRNHTGQITRDVYTFQVASRDQLANIVSGTGDYIKVIPHGYERTFSEYWKGFAKTWSLTSQASNEVTGYYAKTLSTSIPPLVPSVTAYNLAVAKLAERVRGDIDLSIDLLQAKQAFQMINIHNRVVRTIGTTLAGLVKEVDKLDRRTRRRVSRLSAGLRSSNIQLDDVYRSRWYRRRARKLAHYLAAKRLEYVYGWVPMASTLSGLGELFCNPPPDRGWTRVEVSGYDKDRFTKQIGYETRSIFIRYRCSIIGYLVPHDNILLDSASRISSLNPVSMVYETIPFSFVLDWVFDVGTWIRSLETKMLHGSRWRNGCLSEGIKATQDGRYFDSRPGVFISLKSLIRKTRFARSPMQTYPLPRLPSVKINIGANRLLNAAALLTVNARRIDDFILKHR